MGVSSMVLHAGVNLVGMCVLPSTLPTPQGNISESETGKHRRLDVQHSEGGSCGITLGDEVARGGDHWMRSICEDLARL